MLSDPWPINWRAIPSASHKLAVGFPMAITQRYRLITLNCTRCPAACHYGRFVPRRTPVSFTPNRPHLGQA
jgi:hypothetical protein